MHPDDTIVATATPPGTGGVSVVRISGAQVPDIASRMLGSLPAARHATVSTLTDAAGEPLDNGIALYFRAPDSFTGEHVLELHAHGGPIICELLVSAAIELGARRAEPGEFSKRAFLNDKIDLVQAEAIADLIASATSQAARAALRTLTGAFSQAVDALQEQLVRVRLHVEAAIDFPEEEIDFLTDVELEKRLEECRKAFELLQNQANVGRVLREGYQMVIVGWPNAGKSSLLNLLSGEEAAIVTEIAGTTRDILRERINIDGLAVELVDTAGIREDPDQIEEEGIRRARKALKSADAVLWIQDGTSENDDIANALEEEIPPGVAVIVIRNKVDISGDRPGLVQDNPPVINLSAKTGAGIDALKYQIRRLAGYRDLGEGAFTARKRHIEALDKAADHFARGARALAEEKAGELLAEELRLAHLALGEITGEFSSDDLLGRIFSEFCIGK